MYIVPTISYCTIVPITVIGIKIVKHKNNIISIIVYSNNNNNNKYFYK